MITQEAALAQVRLAIDRFLKALDGVSEAQWRFKAAPEDWSLADTAEHVALANQGMHVTLTTRLSLLPPGTPRVADDDIPKIFEHDGPAPDVARPTGRWATREEVLRVLVETREATLAAVERQPGDLRERGAGHPLLGVLDGVQWLIFLAAHTENHTRQVAETKRAPGYSA